MQKSIIEKVSLMKNKNYSDNLQFIKMYRIFDITKKLNLLFIHFTFKLSNDIFNM